MKFSQVTALLEELECQKKMFGNLVVLDWWDSVRNGNATTAENAGCIFDVFRILCPDLDKVRKFDMQEHSLAAQMTRVFGLEGTTRGKRIQEWKGRAYENIEGQGDLGTTIASVFENDESLCVDIGISYLHELLDELSLHSKWTTQDNSRYKAGPRRSPMRILSDLLKYRFNNAKKWIVRIILKNLSISHKSLQIMNAFHPCFTNIYRMQTDLRMSCTIMAEMISEGFASDQVVQNKVLNKDRYCQAMTKFAKPKLHTFISTTECEQAKCIAQLYLDLRNVQNEKSFYTEVKYDGERMQIHISSAGGDITIFSKSGRNSTEDRIQSHDIIKAALGIHNKFSFFNEIKRPSHFLQAQDCILEGELVVYNHLENGFERFGTVADFRGSDKTIFSENRHYHIVFYDILWFNSESQMRIPFSERRKLLKNLVQPINHYTSLSELHRFEIGSGPLLLHDLDRLRSYFCETVAKKREGLVIKGEFSAYKPGRRSWFKMKPDFMLGLGDTAEYCILGGSYLQSESKYLDMRRAKIPYLLNVFYIGVLLNKEEVINNCDPPVFRMAFKMSAGFSRNDLLLFCQTQRDMYVELPENYRVVNTLSGMDTFFKDPKFVTLKGSSFVKNGKYYELRHPRLVAFCGPERNWSDIISHQELQRLGLDASTVKIHNGADIADMYKVINELDGEYIAKFNLKEKRYLESNMLFKDSKLEAIPKAVSSELSDQLDIFEFNRNAITPIVLTQNKRVLPSTYYPIHKKSQYIKAAEVAVRLPERHKFLAHCYLKYMIRESKHYNESISSNFKLQSQNMVPICDVNAVFVGAGWIGRGEAQEIHFHVQYKTCEGVIFLAAADVYLLCETIWGKVIECTADAKPIRLVSISFFADVGFLSAESPNFFDDSVHLLKLLIPGDLTLFDHSEYSRYSD